MKKLGLGCLGLIVVLFFTGCVGVVLMSGGDSEESDVEETEENVETEDSGEVEEESESAELLGIGDSYTIDDITVTVNGVEYTDERNQFHEEPVDSVILINITYENNTGDDIAVGTDFQLYADGEQMDTYPVDSMLGSVSDGRSVTGNVAYGLVGEPESVELEFEPMFSFSGDKGIFDVTP